MLECITGNYFQAGLIGALDHAKEELGSRNFKLKVLLDRTIPPAGGLSSSRAFVVASSLACSFGRGLQGTSKVELTEKTIVIERTASITCLWRSVESARICRGFERPGYFRLDITRSGQTHERESRQLQGALRVFLPST